MMRKVLIISTVPFRHNGITKVILNYFSAMDKENMDIHLAVFCEKNKEVPKSILEQIKSANVYIVPNRKANFFGYVSSINKIMKENKFDVVHINGNSNTMSIELFLAKINGVPNRIAHAHSSSCSHKIANLLMKPLTKMFCTYRLACSEDTGKWLFKREKYVVLKNAICLEHYKYDEKVREDYRKKLNIDDKFVVGHIGLVNGPKNHVFLFDVFKEIIKIKNNAFLLLISGSEKLNSELIEKAKKLNIEDKLLFLTKRDDVPQLLQAMDVFVFPSKHEGLGLVLIEAQASGLPCVVSDGVPKEVKAIDYVEFLSLNKDIQVWANEAVNLAEKDNRKSEVEKQLTDAGYNIYENANILRRIYMGESI